MQAWITLNLNDVATAVTPAEIATHRELAAQSDESDPVLASLAQVIQDVRGYIKAWPQNTMGAEGTIPAELKMCALTLIKGLIPAGKIIDAQLEKELAEADKKLVRVSRGTFKIEPPTVPLANESIAGASINLVRKGRIHRGDEDLRGL